MVIYIAVIIKPWMFANFRNVCVVILIFIANQTVLGKIHYFVTGVSVLSQWWNSLRKGTEEFWKEIAPNERIMQLNGKRYDKLIKSSFNGLEY